MKIFLDESCVIKCFNGVVDNSSLEFLLSITDKIKEIDFCEMHITDDIYELDTGNGNTLYDNIDYSNSDVRDLAIRLGILIDRSKQINVSGVNSMKGLQALLGSGSGGLVTCGLRSKPHGWDFKLMYEIKSHDDIQKSLISYFINAKLPSKDFEKYCYAIFDKIYFYSAPCNIVKLNLSFHECVEDIFANLSYLNNNALNDFSGNLSNDEIIAKAGSVGVEISPESNNTRRNNKAIRERMIDVDGNALSFEWHTKLKKIKGRIHFNARSNRDYRKGEVIIGIITNHLIT